MKMLFICI